jgi:fatty-acyl-CoA synthase
VTFPYLSIGFWSARRAELTPNRVALEIDGVPTTYGELNARSASAAGALASAGVSSGDRVGAYLGNSREYAEALLGCARLGAILVPLSTRLAPPELAFMAEDSGCTALIYDGTLADAVRTFRPQTPVKASFVVGAGDDASWESAVGSADPLEPRAIAPDDVLAIFYTSGTTGQPKGAMLTHGNFFWTNLNMLISFDFSHDERSLVVLPMFHVGGWNVNTLPVWWKGGTVVLEKAFDPARALRLIAERGITSMMGVPTIYQMLADHADFASADLSSVRAFVCGGAPLPVPLIRRYEERGIPFIQGYGLTEAAPNCLALPPEDAVRKAGAAGRPYFFADTRIVDDSDRPVGAGGTGEVVVGGPSVMKGYWNRPEQTAKALRGGFLRTGDVGRVDDEGYITIVDRVKDMYISGGENVYPAEVENVLAGHPAVAEAAVIGVPDERWGESGRAIVVLRANTSATVDEIKSFCFERLAKFKVPASVVFAGVLPRNPTGKLLKPEIRAQYGGAS